MNLNPGFRFCFFILFFILINILKTQSQIPTQLGAEIYLEPGQTPKQKQGIKITATIVPNSPPFHRGKIFFYRTHDMRMYEKEEYREMSEIYVQKIVERYKNSPALDSWWLYNEPSGNPYPDTFAVDEFKKWLEEKYLMIDSLNDSWKRMG